MAQAVDACTAHVAGGGLPFVGVLVNAHAERVSGFGVNRVAETGDPTAHAEIVAMRDAMLRQGLHTLSGYTLLATGEPCGLCYRYAIDHGIERIYVAVDRDHVARFGLDYRTSYPAFGITPAERDSRYRPLPVAHRTEPFTHYLHRHASDRPTARPNTTSKGPSS